jgi:hypothetical protein
MSEEARTSVILDVHQGESVDVSGVVTVQLLHKSGSRSRLRFTAPKSMSIKKTAEDGAPSLQACKHDVQSRGKHGNVGN